MRQPEEAWVVDGHSHLQLLVIFVAVDMVLNRRVSSWV